MNKTLFVCLILLTLILCGGCSQSEWQRHFDWHRAYHIRLYSGGQLIGEWDSKDAVESEEHSNGWHFVDAKTGKLMLVDGQIICETK
jgi:hypothetical protein